MFIGVAIIKHTLAAIAGGIIAVVAVNKLWKNYEEDKAREKREREQREQEEQRRRWAEEARERKRKEAIELSHFVSPSFAYPVKYLIKIKVNEKSRKISISCIFLFCHIRPAQQTEHIIFPHCI